MICYIVLLNLIYLLLPVVLSYYLNVRLLCRILCSLSSFSTHRDKVLETKMKVLLLFRTRSISKAHHISKPYHIHYYIWVLQCSHP